MHTTTSNPRYFKILATLWVVTLFAWTLPAATNAPARTEMPARVTLDEVKRLAFEHNWDLLAAHSDVDMATAQRLVSKEFPNPTLTLGTTKISTDSNPQSTPAGNTLWHRNYDTVAAVSQLFEIGGKRGYRQSSAAAGLRAAESRLQDARRLLDEAVTSAYVSTVLADENVRILRQSSASLRREAEIAQRRLGAGDISEAEKSQIEIAAERLELDANTAATNAVQARVSLEVLVGVSQPRGEWTPGEDLASLVSEGRLADLNRAEPQGLRPDIAAAEALVDKTISDLHFQRAMRIPDPTVSLQYEHEPPDQPNTVGLSVSFPLPLWNHNRGNIRAATAARDQAEILAQRVRAQAAAQLTAARLAYLDALHRWTRYRDDLTPKSGKVRETVAFAYSRGGASLLDLLSAERNDNEIRLATAQAMADAASKAATLRSALNLSTRDTSTHTP